MTNPEERPVDIVFPKADRINAIKEHRCVNPPFGCGKQLEDDLYSNFDDEISFREYAISGLCQTCQDEIFAEPPEDDAPEQLGEL